jgi:DNA polymerase-3 subunit epsilon
MDFTAIDFETANEDLASVCQVGMVQFKGGEIVRSYSSLVNPEDDFSYFNIQVHGITEDNVAHAPTFPEVYSVMMDFLFDATVVSHTAFDRIVLDKSIERYKLPVISCEWLDSACVARRAWSKYARSGYGLANVAKDLDITFNHHNAEEDARAAGLILVRASKEMGIDLEAWKKRLKQPISSEHKLSVNRQGDGDGPLLGEVVVFTGALTIPRQRAADLAAIAGGDVASGVPRRQRCWLWAIRTLENLGLARRKVKSI